MAIATWFLFASFFLISAFADTIDNPGNELVDVLNRNRTAHKASVLTDNPGLACIALQYIKAYQGRCDEVGDKKPADAEFAETFAPNCGIQASTLTPITGRLLGCQSKYVPASEAFSNLLIHNSRSLEILNDKNHTEVGAAVKGTDGGSPYFWCVLFSNGKLNSSFVAEGSGVKKEGPGCFSGTNDDCSSADGSQSRFLWLYTLGILIAVVYAFRL
ncbi:hypothetical protein BVC80_209g81 [Macleaya cordata]|uniref:Ferredoxin-like protein n=1 Tax=Macleaya cordata TaxID=56857 RepID=A0A200QD28_MACCD|nr:hypothetical protein BVC80_209g81 [Macleaya cordata]